MYFYAIQIIFINNVLPVDYALRLNYQVKLVDRQLIN